MIQQERWLLVIYSCNNYNIFGRKSRASGVEVNSKEYSEFGSQSERAFNAILCFKIH